ncbi:hypothetical protein P3S67_023398 [Capsicum chacoense]
MNELYWSGYFYRYQWFSLIHFSFTRNNDVMVISSGLSGSIHLNTQSLKFEEIGLASEVSGASMMLAPFFIGTYIVYLVHSAPHFPFDYLFFGILSNHRMEEDPDEKSQQQSCEFHNHDHKFEWTRQQFGQWASELASRHNYGVEFSGVGGEPNKEPGFASQIAAFRRKDNSPMKVDFTEHCDVIWEWSSSNKSRS